MPGADQDGGYDAERLRAELDAMPKGNPIVDRACAMMLDLAEIVQAQRVALEAKDAEIARLRKAIDQGGDGVLSVALNVEDQRNSLLAKVERQGEEIARLRGDNENASAVAEQQSRIAKDAATEALNLGVALERAEQFAEYVLSEKTEGLTYTAGEMAIFNRAESLLTDLRAARGK